MHQTRINLHVKHESPSIIMRIFVLDQLSFIPQRIAVLETN